MNPKAKPNIGDKAKASNTFVNVADLTAPNPATATPAPKTPATSEWLTLTGNPNRVAVLTETELLLATKLVNAKKYY